MINIATERNMVEKKHDVSESVCDLSNYRDAELLKITEELTCQIKTKSK